MKKEYIRKLLAIAIPIMLSNVISQVQMIIDRIFLGKMDDLYMSALGNVTSPMWTTMSFCFTLSMGASILMSQNVGAGNQKNVEKYAASMTKWSNVLPILLFLFWELCAKTVYQWMGVSDTLMPLCLEYTRFYAPLFLLIGFEATFSIIMQTSNNTKPMVVFGIVRAGLNVLLDWILIFGRFGFPRLGMAGAAIATSVAEFIGCIIMLPVVMCMRNLNTRPSWRAVVKAPLMPFLQSARLGFNAALEDLGWNVGNLVLIRILNSIDDKAAGIYSIVFTVEVLVVVMVGAIGSGTMTLSGEAKGKGDVQQFRSVCKIAYLLCVGLSVMMLAVCAMFPQQILGMFTKDTEIIVGCGIYLLMVCLNLYGKSGNIIVGNGIRGSGNTRWMLGTQLFGTVLVIVSAEFFVNVLHLGIIGVFMAVIVDEGTRALINLWKLKQIIKHWDEIAPADAKTA